MMGTTWASFLKLELYPSFQQSVRKQEAEEGHDAQTTADHLEEHLAMSMSREKRSERGSLPPGERTTMNRVAGNGLTLEELEHLEEAAHHSQTLEAKSVLRLAAALREALQLKECALYTESKDNPERIRNSSPVGANNRLRGMKMPRLRSTLNPEEQPNFIAGPTRYKIGPNQSELVCGFCNGIYYVDEVTFQQAMSAMEEGIDNPFCCAECEAEREELSH